MRIRQVISIILIFVGTGAMVMPALDQTWSEKQLEVWNVIEAQWKAAMEKDANWTDKYLHENFLGWNNQNPAPRRSGPRVPCFLGSEKRHGSVECYLRRAD